MAKVIADEDSILKQDPTVVESFFLDLLRDRLEKPSVEEYCHFLIKEHSPENLLFWQRVDHIKQLEDSKASNEEIVKAFQELFDNHIKRSSRFEINLPANDKKAITKAYEDKNYTYAALEDSQNHCRKLMAQDSFKRFIKEYEEEHGGLMASNKKKDGASGNRSRTSSITKKLFGKRMSSGKLKKEKTNEESTPEADISKKMDDLEV